MSENKRKVFSSYYDVLNVAPDAPQDAIKSAYYKLAKQHHPDKNPSSASKQRLQVLNEAYEALKTPALRDVYDARLKAKKRSWTEKMTALYVGNDNPRTVKPFPWDNLPKAHKWKSWKEALMPKSGQKHEQGQDDRG